jgi:hypothetical protein
MFVNPIDGTLQWNSTGYRTSSAGQAFCLATLSAIRHRPTPVSHRKETSRKL